MLVVGGGGREHALIKALARSPQEPVLFCAPGNAGIAADAEILEVAADDVAALVAAAEQAAVDLVVVGPELALVAGLADALTERGIACFGPSAAAARLEASKTFCKEVMAGAGVPTAAHTVVSDVESGLAAIERYPVVLKADGLAAGKGVTIALDEAQARATLEELLVEQRFGTEQVLVEEHLEGQEISLLALCDGERALPLASARDHKRIFDGDQGPNTGGMGAFSPVPGVDSEQAAVLCAAVHQPVLAELARRGISFRGVLYAGLMMTASGPRVLEFNVRFGDPEAQAILPRLEDDLLEVLSAASTPGGLAGRELHWSVHTAVTVVLASAGYPESSRSGDLIEGLGEPPDGIEITHAGTTWEGEGRIVTGGGRVLGVTGLGASPGEARRSAYAAAEQIKFAGRQMRTDIACSATL